MPKIIHLRQRCIGCNACVEVAYEYWRMSKKDGKAVLIGGKEKKGIYTLDIRDDELEVNLKAAEVCPVKVIRVEGI